MIVAGIFWILFGAPVTAPCQDLVEELQGEMNRAQMAMEPESKLSFIYQRATSANDQCADNESLAYLRLRSAELGRGATVGHQSAASLAEWQGLAQTLARKFPRSVRLGTIAARASGSVDDARRAVSLDPSYAPAQVALAAALISTDPTEAITHLVAIRDLSVVADGHSVLARARFAVHDLDGAEKAATSAIRRRSIDQIEPDARDPRPISAAHEVLGLVFLAKRQFRKAAANLELAAEDSTKARQILEDPPPELRPFLRRRRIRR